MKTLLNSTVRVVCIGLFTFAVALPALAGPNAYTLGTSNLLVGPAAGTNSVVLAVSPVGGAWTASAGNFWLHLSVANQSGTGSANIVFTCDANWGATRVGTIGIASNTLTVTQAGSTFVPVTELIALGDWPLITDPNEYGPMGMAVDPQGNAYTLFFELYSNPYHGVGWIGEWTASNNAIVTLNPTGLNQPSNLALDGAGNFYIADGAIEKWTPSNNQVVTLNISNVYLAQAVAVDGAGNIYIGDHGDGNIKKWNPGTSNLVTLPFPHYYDPTALAVDVAGNVYASEGIYGLVQKWDAATGTVTTLISSGLALPSGLAVDGSGNVYIADYLDAEVKKWSPVDGSVTSVSHGFYTQGVAVDAMGNVFYAATPPYDILEVPNAFVYGGIKFESLAAGTDTLPVVLPASQKLQAPFYPATDSPWLTITGVSNGVVSFAFTAASSTRTGHIYLLGQAVPVIQGVIGSASTITGAHVLTNGAFQFSLTNDPNAVLEVLSTPDVSQPLNQWKAEGVPSETSPGVFQFTTSSPVSGQVFYQVRSP